MKICFQESVEKKADDSESEDKKKRIADVNWNKLEKENKPKVLAAVFKGATLERKKGKGFSDLLVNTVQSISIASRKIIHQKSENPT